MKQILIALPAFCLLHGQVLAGDKPNILVKAQAKWEALGTKTMDLQIAPCQAHRFFNKEQRRTVTLIAVDEFLLKQGLLAGKPPLKAPAKGEKLIPAPEK